ncbi:glycosyltransferase family 4 protein [Curtobacterium sp. ZW137]|uniref:glycosyltransferase family 4 protein n=1 Tax=Curtobacterium sp. ZW137 TaxID=2485104 RepID=UPI00160D86E2|nr:glycosyltransferase [Curtobacterium sp. ZW137]
MTKILLEVLDELGEDTCIVERRFSREVGQIGALSLRKIIAAPSLALRLAMALTRRPSMCIFFCTSRPFSFLVDVILGEILRAFRVPTVNYVHTRGYTSLASRGRIWRFLTKRLLSHAKRTVCLSEALISDVSPFVGSGGTIIIGNTIESPLVPVVRDPEGLILFLSNLLEEKGADIFVGMAIELCKRYPALDFALVGASADPSLKGRLERLVAQAGHSDRIRFLGSLFGDDKWAILARAQLLVFPSRYRYEAQPLTILEAFSLGLPVVASDVGAIGEIVDAKNGRLLPIPAIADAVRAVSEVLDDALTIPELSRGARLTFERNHSRETFRRAWSELIASTRETKR